jgi:hypothetical protein
MCACAVQELLGITLSGAHAIKTVRSGIELLYRLAGQAGVSVDEGQLRAVEQRVAERIYSPVRQCQWAKLCHDKR